MPRKDRSLTIKSIHAKETLTFEWTAMRMFAHISKWQRGSWFLRAASGGLLVLTSLAVIAFPGPVAGADGAPAVTNCNDHGTGSLRQALADAAINATITFPPTPLCAVIRLVSPIAIDANVTIAGPGAGAMAVSGNDAVEDFDVAVGVTASISGLTIEDGSAESGGGIANAGTLTVNDSVVSNNAAGNGGGGGIATLTGATTTVIDSVLSDNTAINEGGAIFSVGTQNGMPPGTVNVENSTLADNTSTVYGGAISDGGPLNVIRSTLSGNSANLRGGGIESYGGPMLIEASTLADNSSASGGGFQDDGSSNTTVVTSTLSGNTGGDITQLAGPLNLEATIVANSLSGPDCSGTIIDHGENLADDGSCGLIYSSDFPDSPAGLDPRGLENNGGPTATIALEPGSPAIDGVNDEPHSTLVCAKPDQRGVARSNPCDIGAVDAVVTSQTINFTSTAPNTAAVGEPPYTVTATATSGLPVSLTIDSSAASVCSLSGAVVSFTGTGECVIDANQAGEGLYAPAAQVQQSFDVGFPPDSITSPDHVTAVVGTPFAFTVTTTGALAITKKGRLPRSHRFVDNGDGTATLSGTLRRAGTFPLTIEARFGQGEKAKTATQDFNLTVDPK
jgi:hypothetical protein